jgi:hypothetical protein
MTLERRWTTLLAALVCLVGAATAQQSLAKPAPGRNEGILGPQLIAWSEMQKPQPVPQKPEPLPPPDGRAEPAQTPATQSQQDRPAQQTQPEPDNQQSTAQSISGTVVKIGNKYVLETADNLAYQLDDQERAKQYENKHVKVMGTLDRTTGIIHVKSIELLS